ncbi:MAG: hypothetical protein KJ799_15240 [Bacteroidetes bacterium]|nr:hypothetical protein [Bacteroidota bacterium]MBU1679934.1 hypothetical protein [Bacteroidota bacterium]MBU2508059.1 hypothetical protein [Bacteroidota bacterium]
MTIEALVLVLFSAFWVLYYIFQGMHDVAFLNEVKLLKNALTKEQMNNLLNSVIKTELSWKFWDALEKLLAKSAICFLIYYILDDILYASLLFLLAVFIRWFVHDLVVAIGLKKGLKHIGPDFIPTDKLLRKLSDVGFNQYIIKLVPILIILAVYFVLKYIK